VDKTVTDVVKIHVLKKKEDKMRNFIVQFIYLFFVCIIQINLSAQEETLKEIKFPVLKGDYLGQKPPGLDPKIFAPGIISTDVSEGCVSFTKDQSLFLFVRAGTGILIMHQVNSIWTEPKLAPFSAGRSDWDFMLAPDDKTLFVSSGRPDKKGDETLRDYRIWITERKGDVWTTAVLLPAPVNTGQHDSYPCATKDGTLYFFSNRDGGIGEGDIYRSKKINGTYKQVENLGAPINTRYHEVDAYVDPEENYMIFCSKRPGGFGGADFYISFGGSKGNWSNPVNMGPKINSQADEYIPYVSPDEKYFFYTSNKTGNREIYWVDARIITYFKKVNKK
jgi:hypothetical protein